MSHTVSIRSMTRGDLPQVLKIETASFTTPFSEQMFLKELELPMAHLLVAVPEVDAETILGYIDWWHVSDEIHVVNMAVSESERRHGVATALVKTMLKDGKDLGARFAYLEVRRSSTAAQDMYEKFGFKRYGERKGYYQDNNEDAVLMGLDL